MSFAGGKGMAFGKGYLGGGKEPDAKGAPQSMPHQEGADMENSHHAQIQEHLKDMHAATGKAHSHVEHHGDGSHTAHHVSADGQMQGPEDSQDCPGGMCGGGGEMM